MLLAYGMMLDIISRGHTGGTTVKPYTHQKLNFCTRQHAAAGLALYIFLKRPGAAS